MQDPISKTFEQATAFQRLWTDSFTKMAGVFTQYSPASPPLEEVRKMRSGFLKVLGETCEEFMRSPQFMEMMRTSLNGMLDLRRLSREGMDRIHEQFDTPDKEDLDGILLAIRHVERRVLDRLEELDARVANLEEANSHCDGGPDSKPQKRATASRQTRTCVAKPSSPTRSPAKAKRSKAGKRS